MMLFKKLVSNQNTIAIVTALNMMYVLFACSQPAFNPKPKGYPRIEMPKPAYQLYATSTCPFTFSYSQHSKILPYKNPGKNLHNCWFNVYYPAFNATLFVTYLPVKNNLKQLLDDAHDLAYEHVIKSSAIKTSNVMNKPANVYGLTFRLEGSPATPFQFFATDSTAHFLRGSLYFNFYPNYDSLRPVVNFLIEDVNYIISTLKWQKQN